MKSRPSKRPAPSAPAKKGADRGAGSSRAGPEAPATVRWAAQDDTERWHEDWDDDTVGLDDDEEPLFDDEDAELADPLESDPDAEEDDEDEDTASDEPLDEDAPPPSARGRSKAAAAEPEPELDLGEPADDDKRRGRRRSKTIARKQMLRERRKMIAQGSIPEVIDYTRPQHRSECRHGERPCLYVSCRYHLFLDVNPVTGSIKLNFPDKEVWDLAETCALDVAERGGITLEEVGEIMNLTRERIRQVEVSGLEKLREGNASLETFVDGRELPALTQIDTRE